MGRNRSQTTWRWAATHLHLRLHGSGQLITIGTWWQGRGIRGCPIGLVDPTFCFPSCSSVAPRAPTLSFGPAMDCHTPNVAIPGPMVNFGAEFRRGRQRGRKGKGTALHTVAPGPHACGVHRETPDGPNGTAQPRERLAPSPPPPQRSSLIPHAPNMCAGLIRSCQMSLPPAAHSPHHYLHHPAAPTY